VKAGGNRTVIAWRRQGIWVASLLLLLASFVVAPGGSPGPRSPISWVLVALMAAAAARALTLGVIVTGQRLVVRTWTRTHHLQVNEIRDVQSVPYRYWYSSIQRVGEWRMVRLVLADQIIDLRSLGGSTQIAGRKRLELRDALELAALPTIDDEME
jgi:hypothetical protein